ncbi:PAS domain S-box protein [Flavobacterium sp.]|uniref:PAS domain S-box protein n=1 Tax=Flavobacterium sp. TaxID=239 RepID=UPI0024890204|nr:PAS domain S-box protein [Flavobacterium sp.]MDI1318072.1 PAS domain S-box protein [Flavobacterium sp.]
MHSKSTNSFLQFLAGGGEMGKLIREKDWSKNKLGTPDTWPQSLRTTLSIILNSKFPMFLFWGPELICFYNDAYLPSLGNDGKHPAMLGGRAEIHWKEIWKDIKPLLNQVLEKGESTWNEDLLLPFYRNGKMEDIYWTFSYSPVHDESGKPAGVFTTCFETTEKVNVLKELHKSNQEYKKYEDKLNIIIDASELGTWELDLKTMDATYSDRYLEIIGGYKEPIKLTHEHLLAHLHPDDLEIRKKAFSNAINNGYLSYEARVIWKDGSIHWMEGKGKVFYDVTGQAEKMIGTIRDTTRERNNQMLLIENERKFRLLSDSMPQQIWTSDTEGNLNYYNKSVFEYSGLSLKDLYEKSWLDIVHPDDKDENIKKWAHSITTRQDFLIEHRFRRYDGEYRWQLSRAIPQRDEDGKIQMWVGSSTDIQDQKTFSILLEKQVKERTKELNLLNEILKESEERYHLMVGEVQDYAILYLSKQGIIENWNKGAERIKGYRTEEIVGKSFSNFYTAEDRQNNLPQFLLDQASKHGRYGQEGWRVRKDGSLFWANVVITAIHNEIDEVIGFSKVTHDLTAKKDADDKLKLNAIELKQKNLELEEMNKELQSFAYISSHDLQEPLRKIQTFSNQIIEKEFDNLSENGKDRFKRMQNAAQRMQTLINDLLAYSRTNTQDVVLTKTDLNIIIKDVIEDLQEEIQEKKATIEIEQVESDVFIVPFQIHQLLFNLLSNSLKFSLENFPPIIKIKCNINKGEKLNNAALDKETKYCHIRFSDNGIGFDQQYSDKIFEVFQRLHGREVYQGTGIGLAIVKKIIDNHKGFITASGEPNKGATFDIYFPVNS